jgi:hypothetical protein
MKSTIASRLLPKLPTLVVFVLFASVRVPYRSFAEGKGPVVLESEDWNYTGGTSSDSSTLRDPVVRLHSAWIRRDPKDCRELLRTDVVRVSQSQAEIQSGKEAVLTSLPCEWAAYEPDDL